MKHNNKMTKEKLGKLLQLLNKKNADKVPDGWHTCLEITNIMNKPRSVVMHTLSRLVKNKIIPSPKNFRIARNGTVRSYPHYYINN